MAAEHVANLLLRGIGIPCQVIARRHQDARRAVAALQPVMRFEGLLQVGQLFLSSGKAFHRIDMAAIGLYRERQAAALRFAVDLKRAGATDAVLATHMAPGHPQLMA